MLNPNDIETIKKTVREFFEKTTFEVEVTVMSGKEDTLPIVLKTEEPQILIGEGGQTLSEIQHLLKAVLRRKITEPFYISLDINDYKKKKKEYLEELAVSTADEVSLSKKEKTLSPMPAYERRIIHMALAGRGDVVTESTGEGMDRRLVIKPRP
ncbi:MAG: KH domain-containing protein [Candidatus Nealsonbacteria bacterium]|nr:KH domain-containing protein [Candidatus Nealsonbacteria bacterium]